MSERSLVFDALEKRGQIAPIILRRLELLLYSKQRLLLQQVPIAIQRLIQTKKPANQLLPYLIQRIRLHLAHRLCS
jgi:hypothetical protein